MKINIANDAVLFTKEGRECVRQLLNKDHGNGWLVCERGFLDHQEGIVVTDKLALEMLLEACTPSRQGQKMDADCNLLPRAFGP